MEHRYGSSEWACESSSSFFVAATMAHISCMYDANNQALQYSLRYHRLPRLSGPNKANMFSPGVGGRLELWC